MKSNLINLPLELRIRIKHLVAYSKENGTYLRSSTSKPPLINPWLVIFIIGFVYALFNVYYWEFYYWLIVFGLLLAFAIFRALQYNLYWNQFGKDSVFFDSKYFISIQNKILNIIPLNNFKYSDIILSSDSSYYIVRFHFDNTSILQPISDKTRDQVLSFQRLLEKYSLDYNQSDKRLDFDSAINISFFQKISFYKGAITFSAIIALFLYFQLPIIIDSNAFKYAKNLNTATAYRNYLSVYNNTKYRDKARFEIRKIYDKYISKYKNSSYNYSTGAEAFIETLEYLRDNNIYNVSIQFFSDNNLNDIYSKQTEYEVVPITPSFTKNKNISRENTIIRTIQNSLGEFFPTDVFNLSNKVDDSIPIFKIYYIYRNNIESLYYKVDEENLPDSQRTWYYGIEIEWWFKIILPQVNNAIFEFSLISSPAYQFDSESFSPDAVYDNMARSAFNDFKVEFFNQFLKD